MSMDVLLSSPICTSLILPARLEEAALEAKRSIFGMMKTCKGLKRNPAFRTHFSRPFHGFTRMGFYARSSTPLKMPATKSLTPKADQRTTPAVPTRPPLIP